MAAGEDDDLNLRRSEPERARAAIRLGVVAFRWAALAWMVILALVIGDFRSSELAWAAIGAAAAWSVWMTVPKPERSSSSLWFELLIAFTLVVSSGVVMPEGSIGSRPLFATAWPAAAVISIAVARGPLQGIAGSLVLGVGLFLARMTNGLAVSAFGGSEWSSIINGTVTFLLASSGVGLVARLLDRSADETHRLVEQTIRARERTARLEEREKLGRQIHDSVLQALAMVHKRGRELSGGSSVPAAEVAALAAMAGEQEAALRALILREPDDAPTGRASLRDALEAAARGIASPPIAISTTGPMWVPAHVADELGAACRQALENVARHAAATSATVFADDEDGVLSVTIRDDGSGFDYDEERLRAAGKMGMLASMKGRVEGLGGQMLVASSADGTEIEFRVPVQEEQ